jgi:CO dehydrogenase maturation factor
LEEEKIVRECVTMKALAGKRILVCGKGGSGKSSLAALIAGVLLDREYEVALIDGDASNPGGLARLVLAAGTGPQPLIEFFGGREKVLCPVDDPSPLLRLANLTPVTETHINLEEIPAQYYVRRENLVLFQVGKIHRAYEGCDGPMSKVTRDFILKGTHVSVIDVEAGIEHFGRGVEKNVDIVLIVVDPTFESFEIAERVTRLCQMMGIRTVRSILNDVSSRELELKMHTALQSRGVSILGSVRHDPEVQRAGLEGSAIGPCQSRRDIALCVVNLEVLSKSRETSYTNEPLHAIVRPDSPGTDEP